MQTPHLAVQVQGLPHQRQGDEFLGALAPGSQEEVSQDSMPHGFLRPQQVAFPDHLNQLSAERGHGLVGLGTWQAWSWPLAFPETVPKRESILNHHPDAC